MDLASQLPLVLTPDPRGFNQGTTESNESALDPCSLLSERHYEVVPCLICSLCCIFGVVYCCFGYRCFKAIMFLSGLLFGSAVIFLLCYKERILDTQLSLEVSTSIALGIGVLCGLVTMLVHSVGLFLTGLLLGLLLATAGLVATEPLYKLPSAWVPAGSLLGSALLGAVLALRWQKAFTVLSTAVFGGAVLTLCLDYAVENLALGQHIYDRLRLAPFSPLCWCAWAVLATWPVLSLMGVLLQWKVTAEGFSHTDVVLNRRQKQLQLLRIRQREAKKKQSQTPHEGSYRHKTSVVKRCAGDVLAPSYIQSLRDRQQLGTAVPQHTGVPPHILRCAVAAVATACHPTLLHHRTTPACHLGSCAGREPCPARRPSESQHPELAERRASCSRAALHELRHPSRPGAVLPCGSRRSCPEPPRMSRPSHPVVPVLAAGVQRGGG